MDISLYAGDSKNLIRNVIDEEGNAVSLYGSSITWVLVDSGGTTKLTKTIGSGVTLTDATGGKYKIAITSSDTTGLNGSYSHACRVTTSSGDSAIVEVGTVTITEGLI